MHINHGAYIDGHNRPVPILARKFNDVPEYDQVVDFVDVVNFYRFYKLGLCTEKEYKTSLSNLGFKEPNSDSLDW